MDSLLLNVASVVAVATWSRDVLGNTSESALEAVRDLFRKSLPRNGEQQVLFDPEWFASKVLEKFEKEKRDRQTDRQRN